MASLLFNVIGAPIAGKTPLELIRVYLTFPLGEKALELELRQPGRLCRGRWSDPGDRLLPVSGEPACCWEFRSTWHSPGLRRRGGCSRRLAVATVVSLAIWAFNFYAILSWLQPLLVGGDPGNWITNPKFLPWWVAAATHVVFGWTIALLYSWGVYTPYRRMKT